VARSQSASSCQGSTFQYRRAAADGYGNTNKPVWRGALFSYTPVSDDVERGDAPRGKRRVRRSACNVLRPICAACRSRPRTGFAFSD
jgi:hypothetical protein